MSGDYKYQTKSKPTLTSVTKYHKQKSLSSYQIPILQDILHFLCSQLLEKYPRDRLGYKGGDYPSIRDHAFFHGFDWDRVEALEMDRPP